MSSKANFPSLNSTISSTALWMDLLLKPFAWLQAEQTIVPLRESKNKSLFFLEMQWSA
jgi:hypothetical protein